MKSFLLLAPLLISLPAFAADKVCQVYAHEQIGTERGPLKILDSIPEGKCGNREVVEVAGKRYQISAVGDFSLAEKPKAIEVASVKIADGNASGAKYCNGYGKNANGKFFTLQNVPEAICDDKGSVEHKGEKITLTAVGEYFYSPGKGPLDLGAQSSLSYRRKFGSSNIATLEFPTLDTTKKNTDVFCSAYIQNERFEIGFAQGIPNRSCYIGANIVLDRKRYKVVALGDFAVQSGPIGVKILNIEKIAPKNTGYGVDDATDPNEPQVLPTAK